LKTLTEKETEMSEEKLLPCLICGDEPEIVEHYGEDFQIECSSIGSSEEYDHCIMIEHISKKEAIKMWNDLNRRARAQWTAEPPTEPGWYFQYQEHKDPLLVEYYLCSEGLVSCAHAWTGHHYVDSHDISKPAYWCKIIQPPLPGKEDAKDE